jgi:hypothetical protein
MVPRLRSSDGNDHPVKIFLGRHGHRVSGAEDAAGFIGRASIVGLGLRRQAPEPEDPASVLQRDDVLGVFGTEPTTDAALIFVRQRFCLVIFPLVQVQEAEAVDGSKSVGVVEGEGSSSVGQGSAQEWLGFEEPAAVAEQPTQFVGGFQRGGGQGTTDAVADLKVTPGEGLGLPCAPNPSERNDQTGGRVQGGRMVGPESLAVQSGGHLEVWQGQGRFAETEVCVADRFADRRLDPGPPLEVAPDPPRLAVQ